MMSESRLAVPTVLRVGLDAGTVVFFNDRALYTQREPQGGTRGRSVATDEPFPAYVR